MKYTTVYFPQDLLASQGAGRGSGPSQNWMLVRRWRVMARRVLLVAIVIVFIYTTAVLLILMLAVIRIPSLQTALYILMCLGQVLWLCVLGAAFFAYCKRRSWLRSVTTAFFLLLFLKGISLVAMHINSLWCTRPQFGEEYIFTVPFDVSCVDGICTLPVAKDEQPMVCAVMERFFKEVGGFETNPRSVAAVLYSQQLFQVFLAVAIIVHAIEDGIRLGH